MDDVLEVAISNRTHNLPHDGLGFFFQEALFAAHVF